MPTSLSVHQLLEKIASRDITSRLFPTHFNAILRHKRAVDDPYLTFKQLTETIAVDSLISARVIEMANLHHGDEITTIEDAVDKLSINTVRRAVLGIVMSQLAASKTQLRYVSLPRSLWLNSLYASSAAFIISKKLTAFPPDECLLQGLWLNVGGFYYLDQIRLQTDLSASLDEVESALSRHMLRLSYRFLRSLNLPKSLVNDFDIDAKLNSPLNDIPRSRQDVLVAAYQLALERYPAIETLTRKEKIPETYQNCLPEIEKHFQQRLKDTFIV